MLDLDDTAVVLVDVQGKLASLMVDRAQLFDHVERLLGCARALELPIVWTEQIPEKMGATLDRFLPHLEGLSPLPKSSFGCCGEPAFMDALEATGRNSLILAGIETHVCVYQTAAGLVERGYRVEVPADAVSSRTARNRDIGLRKIEQTGAALTSVETAVLELLGDAAHPRFRDILRLIK